MVAERFFVTKSRWSGSIATSRCRSFLWEPGGRGVGTKTTRFILKYAPSKRNSGPGLRRVFSRGSAANFRNLKLNSKGGQKQFGAINYESFALYPRLLIALDLTPRSAWKFPWKDWRGRAANFQNNLIHPQKQGFLSLLTMPASGLNLLTTENYKPLSYMAHYWHCPDIIQIARSILKVIDACNFQLVS